MEFPKVRNPVVGNWIECDTEESTPLHNRDGRGDRGSAAVLLQSLRHRSGRVLFQSYNFSEVTPCLRICWEKSFGPVVSAVRVVDLDEAFGLIEKHDFGSGVCFSTRSLNYAERFVSEVDVGMVEVNVGHSALHSDLPYEGIQESHLGSDKVQGGVGIDFFTQREVATVHVTPPGGSVIGDSASKSCSVRGCGAS